jgi:hypothetical protein
VWAGSNADIRPPGNIFFLCHNQKIVKSFDFH